MDRGRKLDHSNHANQPNQPNWDNIRNFYPILMKIGIEVDFGGIHLK